MGTFLGVSFKKNYLCTAENCNTNKHKSCNSEDIITCDNYRNGKVFLQSRCPQDYYCQQHKEDEHAYFCVRNCDEDKQCGDLCCNEDEECVEEDDIEVCKLKEDAPDPNPDDAEPTISADQEPNPDDKDADHSNDINDNENGNDDPNLPVEDPNPLECQTSADCEVGHCINRK